MFQEEFENEVEIIITRKLCSTIRLQKRIFELQISECLMSYKIIL